MVNSISVDNSKHRDHALCLIRASCATARIAHSPVVVYAHSHGSTCP